MPISEAVIALGTATRGPDEGVVIQRHIHIPGNSLAQLFVDYFFHFFQSIFFGHRTDFIVVICRAY